MAGEVFLNIVHIFASLELHVLYYLQFPFCGNKLFVFLHFTLQAIKIFAKIGDGELHSYDNIYVFILGPGVMSTFFLI